MLSDKFVNFCLSKALRHATRLIEEIGRKEVHRLSYYNGYDYKRGTIPLQLTSSFGN
jgi:hypothetical protein